MELSRRENMHMPRGIRGENYESIDKLTKFHKMLTTFDRRLLELNGVHFWRLCFFEVSAADIRFLD